MDDSLTDKHPNNAWINGALDDVRIYTRVLSPTELFALYASSDKQSPTAPPDLQVRTDSSSQTELTWSPGTDNFRVQGYKVRRNGVVVATPAGTRYVDSGLTPSTTYAYTVQAYDPAGNVSDLSPQVVTNTPAAGSGVEVIIDDAYGPPWVATQGTWRVSTTTPNFWGSDFLGGYTTLGSISATFRPNLPEAGSYKVYVWNPGASSYPMYVFSATIPVDIVHGTTTNTVMLNEQNNYATWNLLGTFSLNAGTNNFLRFRLDGTGNDVVSADAVRFVK
jgi:hypothetical protein